MSGHETQTPPVGNAPQRFRKKPVVIEAVQWTGDWPTILNFVVGQGGDAHTEGDALVIATLEGDHRANLGDWIIRGVAGEFYPCKPDIFGATYEPAGAANSYSQPETTA